MLQPGECRQTPERQILASLLAGRLSPFQCEIIFAGKNADENVDKYPDKYADKNADIY